MSELVSRFKYLLNLPKSKLKDPELRFDVTPKAATKNLELLRKHDYDLLPLCNRGKARSVTSFGSEFREINDLENIF